MKNKIICCTCALLLGACAAVPVPTPAAVDCVPVAVAVAAPEADPALARLLLFQSGVRLLKPAELARALAEPDGPGGSAEAALRRAMLLAAQRGGADLARAQDEAQEKLALQAREGQRRNEQLSEKLEALKDIERSLSVRAPAAPSK
jgi:hypothetical protein